MSRAPALTAAIVKPLSKDHISITLSPDHRVVWFKLASGGAEIVVLDKNATETTRLAVAPPQPGHALKITTTADGVEISYKEWSQ